MANQTKQPKPPFPDQLIGPPPGLETATSPRPQRGVADDVLTPLDGETTAG